MVVSGLTPSPNPTRESDRDDRHYADQQLDPTGRPRGLQVATHPRVPFLDVKFHGAMFGPLEYSRFEEYYKVELTY